jgi:membrane fusion protein, multidrug efflux system
VTRNRILFGACIAVVVVGMGAPAIVSSRAVRTERQPPPVFASETNAGTNGTRPSDKRPDQRGFLGVVVALQSVELSARFDGTVERVDVQVGDHVKGGTPIARMDTRSIAQDLAIAEASLRVGESDHDRLVIELADASDRRARLQSIPELVAREQLAAADSLERVAAARLRGSVAELAGKRARTDQLRQMLRDAQLIAPFDGTIASRHVDAGTTVSRSTPIVRVISPASLVIRFAVPEEQAADLALGRKVTVSIASVNLLAGGVVESVVPEIDAALRMVVIEARLITDANHADTIPAGAIARVLIPGTRDSGADDLPTANPALSEGDGSTGHERSIH